MTISGSGARTQRRWRHPWTGVVAEVVSIAFSPLAYLTLYLAAVFAVGAAHPLRPTLLLWLGLCVAPGAVILGGKLWGVWSDIEVSLLPERRVMLGIVAAIYASVYLACTAWTRGMPVGLRSAAPALLAATLMAAAISFFWRISLHALSAGVITGLSLSALGPTGAIVALVLAAAVAWSRVCLGRHDLAQVAAGTTLGLLTALAVAFL